MTNLIGILAMVVVAAATTRFLREVPDCSLPKVAQLLVFMTGVVVPLFMGLWLGAEALHIVP